MNGVIPGGESYETMSGTSMAAPQIAGMAALVAQYLKETGLAGQEDLSLRQLSQSLLMSTAQPLMEGWGELLPGDPAGRRPGQWAAPFPPAPMCW